MQIDLSKAPEGGGPSRLDLTRIQSLLLAAGSEKSGVLDLYRIQLVGPKPPSTEAESR